MRLAGQRDRRWDRRGDDRQRAGTAAGCGPHHELAGTRQLPGDPPHRCGGRSVDLTRKQSVVWFNKFPKFVQVSGSYCWRG